MELKAAIRLVKNIVKSRKKNNEPLLFAIEVMKQQIPQKPKEIYPMKVDGEVVVKIGRCPVCEVQVSTQMPNSRCASCDTKLDWEPKGVKNKGAE